MQRERERERERERTPQEKFWAGIFGDNYIERNSFAGGLGGRFFMWSKISSKCQYPISSAFEVGCNTGANLHVLKNIFPEIQLEAVEINKKAADMAGNIGFTVYNTSISEFNSGKLFDIVFTSGVLIHIHPDELDAVYDKIYSLSKKYILICEYYNPVPVEIVYRGEKGKLFKRDFAGELLDRFPDLRLVDYAFSYHRDPVFPQDDSTYFLLEKK